MRYAAAVLALLGAIVLSGCSGPSLKEGCTLLDETVDDTVSAVARVAYDDSLTKTDYADAARQVEALIPALRDAELSDELDDSQALLLDRMADLVKTLDEGNPGWAVTLAVDMQQEWVSLNSTCANL